MDKNPREITDKGDLPRYRAGIIGLGFIGAGDQTSGDAIGGQQVSALDGTHARALAGHPRIELVAGSSRDAGRCERFAARSGCRTYSDWRAMLETEQLDIVSIAIYAPVHREMTLAAIESGVKAIYCEKPIATTTACARAMVHACQEAGVVLAINHNRRFHPLYRRLRDVVSTGELGELTSVSLHWGGGRLGNVGTHLFDATCMLTGRHIEAVSGTLDVSEKPDCRGEEFHDYGGFGWLRLEGGLMASVNAANYGVGRPQLVLHGTRGYAETGAGTVTLHLTGKENQIWEKPDDGRSSMDNAVREIVATLDGAAPFPYPASEAAGVLEAIAAFHLSHLANGAWVALPLSECAAGYEVQTA